MDKVVGNLHMSLTQTLNLKHAELIERMARLVNLDTQLPWSFRGVFTKQQGNWSLLMGVVKLSDKVDELDACSHRYPEFQFMSMPFEGITLSELMISLNNGDGLPFANLPEVSLKDCDLNWSESLIPSHANEGVYPERLYSSHVCSDVYCHDDKLIAHGMPFHSSAFDYVKTFLGIERFQGSSDGRKGELSILIPDRRGYLTVADQEVTFSCQNDESYSVVGAIDGESVQLYTPDEVFEVELGDVSDVELWLVTGNDEIIDYRSSSEWSYRHETRLGNISQVDELLSVIARGESEHCEFKKYIDLVDKQNKKAWEIEKTICAFSNHKGGRLFIGVDDDTQVVGIDERCTQHYGCQRTEAADHYVKAVNKRLLEFLTKNQCFKVYWVELFDQLVVVVEVQKTKGLNELSQKKTAYIRRGASSRLMTPTEIQALPSEKDALGLGAV